MNKILKKVIEEIERERIVHSKICEHHCDLPFFDLKERIRTIGK